MLVQRIFTPTTHACAIVFVFVLDYRSIAWINAYECGFVYVCVKKYRLHTSSQHSIKYSLLTS